MTMHRELAAPLPTAVASSGAARSQSTGPTGQRAAGAIVLAAGLLCGVGGFVAIVAWLTRNATILQWPTGNPMVFNTALCLAVTGAAMVALSRREWEWEWLGLVAAGLDIVVGTLVLTEYTLDRRLGIDELLIDAHIEGIPSLKAGRMAFNTAVCFILVGVGLLAAGHWWPWRHGATVAAATGSLTAAVAVLSLFGYTVGISTAYSWLSQNSMALPTGILMLIAAFGLVALAWRADPRGQWLAMPAAAVSLGAVGMVWLAFTDRQLPTFGVQGDAAIVAVAAAAVLTAVLVAIAVWAALRADHNRRLATASEARLFQFLDALPVGVFITSEAGHPYFANTEAVRLLGRGLRPDVGGESLPEVYHAYIGGTDRPYPAQDMALARARRGETALVDDMDIHQPGGVVLAVEVRGKPIYADDGGIDYAIVAFTDITGRRAAEQAIADQASLLDLAHDAIVVSDTQGMITYWNRGAERTYGFTRAEALGRVSSTLLRTQLPIALADIDTAIDLSGSWQGELIQRRRDGTSIVVASRWAARLDPDGSRVATMEINRDITDAKESSAYARRLIEASPDSLVLIGLDGTITDVNESAELVTATPREQLIGAGFGDFFTEPERALEGYQRVLTQGVLTNFPLVVRRPDGVLIDEMVNASLYRNASDEVVGVFVTARDVTDHNRAERELARRAADLEQSNVALTRSNAELEQFAYIASHDLAEPLRAIAGPLAVVARQYRGQLDPQADQFIGFAVEGCRRMQTLIDGLLAFSRVGRLEQSPVPTDAADIVQGILTALYPTIQERHVNVTVGPLPVVMAEPIQLTQVFQNLISNALKFTTPDLSPQIGISAEPDGDHWRFEISDNGIGIDPRYQERIFGMFKRLHGRDAYPGSGIGLALVKKIVERHGGEVGLTCAATSAGSRFWFTLPTTGEPPP